MFLSPRLQVVPAASPSPASILLAGRSLAAPFHSWGLVFGIQDEERNCAAAEVGRTNLPGDTTAWTIHELRGARRQSLPTGWPGSSSDSCGQIGRLRSGHASTLRKSPGTSPIDFSCRRRGRVAGSRAISWMRGLNRWVSWWSPYPPRYVSSLAWLAPSCHCQTVFWYRQVLHRTLSAGKSATIAFSNVETEHNDYSISYRAQFVRPSLSHL